MTIELIDTAGRFAAMREEWNGLLDASSAHSPFLRWEWLNAWWTHLAGARRLAIVGVRDGSRLVAIAPLCVSRGRLPLLLRFELMGTGFAGSDYLDAFVHRGREVDAMRALTGYIRHKDVALHLVRLPHDSWLARLAPALTETAWFVRTAADGFCPFIRLAGHTWDSFLATIGPAHRATTRRRLRTLGREFDMRFDRVTDAATREFALGKLFDFHRARFGSRGTAFHTRAVRAFHRDVAERLQKGGVLRLFTLHLRDTLAAVLYGIAFKDRFYFYQHGYDPQFQSQGAGRAVLDLSIRSAIDEGLAEFDLLYGGESYKSAWTSETRPLTRLEMFPAHVGGRLHKHAVETERTLRAFARRVIPAHAPQPS